MMNLAMVVLKTAGLKTHWHNPDLFTYGNAAKHRQPAAEITIYQALNMHPVLKGRMQQLGQVCAAHLQYVSQFKSLIKLESA